MDNSFDNGYMEGWCDALDYVRQLNMEGKILKVLYEKKEDKK